MFLGKSGKYEIHPPKLCAGLPRTKRAPERSDPFRLPAAGCAPPRVICRAPAERKAQAYSRRLDASCVFSAIRRKMSQQDSDTP